ncbi:MAG: hypothetical protein IJA77_03295 [Clostridia bacterium]|nr:hypothetical protein [Clostridia bacterium]
MELKKSYRGLVWWMLGFVAGMLAIAFLPLEDAGLIMRVLLSFTAADVALLAYIVWRTEQVYWYNGTEYEEAVAAGSERRKAFAWRHFRIFGWYAVAQVIFSVGMHLTGLPWWIDIIVFCVGLCTAAFSTMPIKL